MKEITFQNPSLSTYDVYEFNDNEQGPEIVFTAGVHGVEQTAIHVAFQLIELLPNYSIKGKVKIIPIVNKPAYFNRTRTSPYDNLDLNRIFPGDKDGSQSKQLAHHIWQETREADYIIDLHCCGQHGSNYVMSLYQDYEEQYKLASQIGIKHVVRSGGASGQLFLEACKVGQQAALLELKGGQPDGMVDLETAEFTLKRMFSLLNSIGVITSHHGKNDVAIDDLIFHENIETISANKHGFFNPKRHSGEHCFKGDVLGELDNEAILAPYDGLIAAINYPRYTFSGERMVRYAKLYENN